MLIILASLTFFSGLISLVVNKDFFSPSKFYLLSLFVYFFDVFITEQNVVIYFVYIIFLFLGIFFIFLEKNAIKHNYHIKNNNRLLINEGKILIILWTISIIPIFTQLYLIFLMGGFFEYMNSLKFRVVEWGGIGYILVLKKIFPIVTIIYFMLGVIFEIKRKMLWWVLFGIHVVLMIMLGLLSGSRGSALLGLFYMIIIGNFYIKRITIFNVAILVFIFILIASTLGQVRSTFKYTEDEGFDSNKHGSETSQSLTTYGTVPLNIILDHEFTDYQYGLTFASIITNFVPRLIWEEKPDTGGVILTKFQSGIFYTGTSNYSPGILVESVLNFGYFFGTIIGVLILLILMKICSFSYYIFLKNLSYSEKKLTNVKVSYYYLLFISIPGGMLYGEFTNILFNALINLLLFKVIYFFLDNNLKTKKLVVL